MRVPPCFGCATILVAVTVSSLAWGQKNPNPGVVPPGSKVQGKTIGEWTAEWWQWALSIPNEEGIPGGIVNPLYDQTGQYIPLGNYEPVFFLPGTADPTVQPTRELTIPCGKYLLLSMMNAVYWAPGDCDPADMDPCFREVKLFIDGVQNPACSVDGTPLVVSEDYQQQAPVFPFAVPMRPVFGLDPNTCYRGASDGYWFLLEPLPDGEHEIHIQAAHQPDFTQNVTYRITVEPCLFRRGDANEDGTVNLTDAVFVLGHLFLGDPPPPCLDAADADDNGALEITDAIRILTFLFLGAEPPPAPGPCTCGPDETADELVRCQSLCDSGPLGPNETLTVGSGNASVAASDLDGDGDADLAVADPGANAVEVFLQSPAGELPAAPDQIVPAGFSPDALALRDLDGNGERELVACALGEDALSVYRLALAGEPEEIQTVKTGSDPAGIAFGDVNSDGRSDMVVANAGSNTASVFLQSEGGTLGDDPGNGDPAGPSTTLVAGDTPSSVAIGDLNGDGRNDVVVTNLDSPCATVYYQNENHTLGNDPQVLDPQPCPADASQCARSEVILTAHGVKLDGPRSAVIGDLGDGRQSVVMANEVARTVSFYPTSLANTLFARPGGILELDFRPGSVTIADLNGDGFTDLAVSHQDAPTVSIYHGDGSGNFGTRPARCP